MGTLITQVKRDIENIVDEWLQSEHLKTGNIFIIGCSTSEVIGETIGTAGSEQVAEVLFQELHRLTKNKQVSLAFQCCEHLNRALVIERATLTQLQLAEVAVVPVPSAGGSMAAHAYQNFTDSVMVEDITADAGIDIGNTLIGMHLKKVAVPLRLSQKKIGNAFVTAAYTRPKLIGGERAQYAKRV